MYCPRCAVNNGDEASFCRACGANISLVPQALTGRLPEKPPGDIEGQREGRRRRGRGEPPTLETAVQNIFIGLAFLLVFLAGLLFFRGGFMIWVWFIIPAFTCLGKGVGQFMRVKHEEGRMLPSSDPERTGRAVMPPGPPRFGELPPRDTSEILRPPTSVTESTTRHLDAPVPAKPYGGASPESSKEV